MRSLPTASSRKLRSFTTLVFILSLIGGLFAPPAPAVAQTLTGTSLSEGSFKVTIDQNSTTAGRATVSIGPATLREVFAVESPSRIVLDVTGLKLRRNRTLNVSPSALIRGIRVGVHNELVRVVIDCQSATPPQFEVQGKSGTLQVVLTAPGVPQPSGTAAPISSSPAELPLLPTPTPPNVISPGPVESARDTAAPNNPPAIGSPTTPDHASSASAPAEGTGAGSAAVTVATTPSIAAPSTREDQQPVQLQNAETDVIPTPSSQATKPAPNAPIEQHAAIVVESDTSSSAAGKLVQRIAFEPAAAELPPSIRIVASRRGEFKLAKADDRSFELTLPGYRLSDTRLALPQFPTDEFMGITFVQAESTGEGVRVRIGVDRGTRLSAVWRDTQITISAR